MLPNDSQVSRRYFFRKRSNGSWKRPLNKFRNGFDYIYSMINTYKELKKDIHHFLEYELKTMEVDMIERVYSRKWSCDINIDIVYMGKLYELSMRWTLLTPDNLVCEDIWDFFWKWEIEIIWIFHDWTCTRKISSFDPSIRYFYISLLWSGLALQ